MAKILKMTRTSALIGLAIEEKRQDGFYHVYARPVWIGMTPMDLARVDAGRPLHESIPSDRIRNMGDYAEEIVNGICFDDLAAGSQGNEDEPRRLYAWEVYFESVYRVDLRKATRMAKTLTLIEKRMTALENKFGRPATFGTYLLRVADAIGATHFVFPVDKRSQTYLSPQRIVDLTQGAYKVDALVEQWVTQRQREQEAREEQAAQQAAREAAVIAAVPTPTEG